MSQPTRPTDRPNRVDHVYELIGYTPVVRLNRMVPEGSATVYVKLESANPGGSVKDRIALSIIEDAEARGALKPGHESWRPPAATPASASPSWRRPRATGSRW